MGTSLTGKNISASYLGLLKTTDNAIIGGTAKRLTDGDGNDSPLFLSTSQLGIGVTPTEALTISSGNIQLSNDNKLQFGTSDVYIQGTTATDNIQIGLQGATKLTLHQTDGLTLAQYGSGSITGTVTQRLGVTSSGQVVEIPIGSGAVDGSGATGQATFWTDSDTISGDNDFYWDNTNKRLGIGTSSPSYEVGVGDGTTERFVIDIGSITSTDVSLATNDRNISIDASGTGARSISFKTGSTPFGGTERMKIASGGAVTIENDLTVKGDVFRLDNGTAVHRLDNDDTNLIIEADFNNSLASSTIQFSIDNDEKMRLDSSGRLGIGTVPGRPLHVIGQVAIANAVDASSTGALLISCDGTSNKIYSRTVQNVTGSHPIDIWQGSSQVMRIDSSGDVGIGASTIDGKLHIAEAGECKFDIEDTGGQDYRIFVRSSDNIFGIYDKTNSRTWFRHSANATASSQTLALLETGGSVGIGDSNPADKLEINGKGTYPHIRLTNSTNTSRYMRIGMTDATTHTIEANGSSAFLQFVTGGSEKARLDSSGNLGIASTDVQKNLSIGNAQGDGIQFNYDTTNSYRNQILNYWNSSTDSRMDFNIARTANATPETIMSVGYNSNVGIGTATPSAPLHISSNNGAIARFANNSATLTTTFLNVINANDTSNGTVIAHIDDGTSYIGNQQNNALRLVTNDTERMRIDSSGLVSISNLGVPTLRLNNTDTSLAAQTLGAIEFYQNDPSATGVGVVSKISSVNESSFEGNAGMRFYTGTAGDLRERLHITAGGEIGIGCTPTNIFEVQPTSGCLFSFTGSSTSLYTTTFDIDNDGLSIGHNSAVRKFHLKTNGLKRITITGGGSVGIGSESPGSKFQIGDGTGSVYQTIDSTNGGAIAFKKSGTSSAFVGEVAQGLGSGDGLLLYTYSGGDRPIKFYPGGSERGKITNGGYLKASNNGTYYSSTGSIHELRSSTTNNATAIISHTGASPYGLFVYHNTDVNNTTNYFFGAGAGASDRFFVYSNGNVVNSNNSYGAISDIKLKENITDASSKLDDLLQVKVRNFNYIGDDKKQLGVIAQELEEIFPSMIDESPDFEEQEVPQLDENEQEVLDENGDVVMTTEKVDLGTTTKSVKYSVFVPMLIKAMQEQQTIIQELKAEIDELKKKL